jgi:hypothetical protein
VAANVTGCPGVEGFDEEVSVVVVVAFEIIWLKAVDVLVA